MEELIKRLEAKVIKSFNYMHFKTGIPVYKTKIGNIRVLFSEVSMTSDIDYRKDDIVEFIFSEEINNQTVRSVICATKEMINDVNCMDMLLNDHNECVKRLLNEH